MLGKSLIAAALVLASISAPAGEDDPLSAEFVAARVRAAANYLMQAQEEDWRFRYE